MISLFNSCYSTEYIFILEKKKVGGGGEILTISAQNLKEKEINNNNLLNVSRRIDTTK